MLGLTLSNATIYETLVSDTLAALKEPASETPQGLDTSTRQRFYELIVCSLGGLFAKSPVAAQMYDRTTLLSIIEGMADTDASIFGKCADDWIRLQGIINQQEGQRSYYLPLQTMAALSGETSGILMGDLFEMVLKRYSASMPSENLRNCTRKLASHFLIAHQKH
jgi:hypothetical protein